MSKQVLGSVKSIDGLGEYRAVLFERDGRSIVAVEERIGGHFMKTPGQWYLSTLANSRNDIDMLMIDAGQHWGVRGMRRVVDKAIEMGIEH